MVYKVSFTFNLGTPYLGQYSQPLVYTVMRDAFDYSLVQKAQQVGASFMDGQKVTQVQVNVDWVEISTADNTFRSRLVVGADGAYSVVSRELGMGRNIKYNAGLESDF